MVFLSGPVVKTLPSNAGSTSSVPGWELRSHRHRGVANKYIKRYHPSATWQVSTFVPFFLPCNLLFEIRSFTPYIYTGWVLQIAFHDAV